ncbi:hypothetical protein ABT039_22585 [Streptomyces lasiicapitis]|uniref:hypothetical protein n=1 Tax=Streptomyces lasiicapitis TaxID=1923961 RepID=UPI0033259A6A
MAKNTATATPQTFAERVAHERQEASINHAVDVLRQGKFLILTNDSEGRLIGNCGLDPHVGRDWLTRHIESGVRTWD